MLLKKIIRWALGLSIGSVALAGLVSWIYWEEIAYWRASPSINYGEMAAIAQPVYLFPKAWAARPDIASRALLTPDGIEPEKTDLGVDVFYIHPSAYWGDNWNAEFDDADSAKLVEGQMLVMDLTPFNGCCRVFAPRYRQAHGIFLDKPSANGRQALELANNDIERAFTHYITREQNGRPFIIVGHGQGALLAMRIMDRRVDNDDRIFDDFVAAYLVGAGVPLERFGDNWENITACEDPSDTGCVVSWEAYLEDTDPTQSPNTPELWYDRYWTFTSEVETLCINPITWTQDSEVAKSGQDPQSLAMNPGFSPQFMLSNTPKVEPEDFDSLPMLTNEILEAQCRNGALHVKLSNESSISGFGVENGNLDQHAISLFWLNIRENAKLRSNKFLEDR